MPHILDSSAVLAYLLEEPGREVVADAITAGAGLCAGNLAEAITVLIRGGMRVERAALLARSPPVTHFELDFELAFRCGSLFAQTRSAGLSLGDRMRIALAIREGLPAMTADRAWSAVADAVGVTVMIIR